ncbi:MAG: glycosyltransferase [Bacteroidota bacterium]
MSGSELLLFAFCAMHLLVTAIFTWLIMRWRSNNARNSPTISIIIAARNEAKNLGRLIPKLQAQDYPNFEIVIGLDRCEDESAALLKSFKNPQLKFIDIEHVAEGWNGKKYALDQAILNASGEWLVFTDADCAPNSNRWLTSLSKEITSSTNVLIGISPYLANRSFLSKYIQHEAFMTYFLYLGFALIGRPYMAVGRNMAVKKRFFEEMGGYKKIKGVLGGDDDLFIQQAPKKDIKVCMGPDSLIFTEPAESLAAYKNQKFRHFSVAKHYSKTDLLLLSVFHGIHLTFYFLLIFHLKNTWILPVVLFYLSFQLTSYRFVSHKIGTRLNYLLFPFVDLLYALATPLLSIWSRFVNNIEWKS